MADFTKLGLKKIILEVIDSLEFTEALDVQEKVIPLALTGKNVVFTSRTGSGKTLAYALGYLGKINKKMGLQVLVVVPTRELCIQVGKEMRKLCDPLNLKVGILYGGRDPKGDYRTLMKKNQVLVATPGRLIEYVNVKKIKLGDVKYLVYDESDQMFDFGFYDECVYLKTRVSSVAQVILASATITEKVGEFAEDVIVDYELLKIGQDIPENIVQRKILTPRLKKNDVALKVLKSRRFKRAMIFCNTKIKTCYISQFLNESGIKTRYLNSDLDQIEREDNMRLFHAGDIKVLVTTDVAARGLQIESVDIVINYDIPTKNENYIHRIGRTGRKDAEGYAVSLICPDDEDRFYNIEFDYELSVKEA